MVKKSKSSDGLWYSLALARIGLGFMLLWAFVDKLFGLGFATCRDIQTNQVARACSDAWVNGGSPTDGFLKFAAKGPMQDIYNGMVGNQFVSILFMVGLLLIGMALILGIGVKIAVASGTLLFLMMWSSVLPPENNPILDDHIIYIFTLLAIGFGNDNQRLGLGGRWSKQGLVKQYPILQ
jgi:thiosulfate dehydrogenase [quinone] large subunit